MILFLNFAPIEFMGGVERRIFSFYSDLRKTEKVKIICVSPSIANIYGQLVLKRKFTNHLPNSYSKILKDTLYVDFFTLIPFTKKWNSIRQYLKDSRIIYCKFELNEIILLTYLGNFSIFKKTVAAIRSPFTYYSPIRLLDKIHNYVYSSPLSIYFLNQFKAIHVLNRKDFRLFRKTYKISKLLYVPNGIETKKISISSETKSHKPLRVVFVGELSKRKGVDILIKTIHKSPVNYLFDIVGDGYLKNEVMKLAKKKSNTTYHGYVEGRKLTDIYLKGDVFLYPSRAETFGSVMLESAYCGNVILNSEIIKLNLPNFIEKNTINNKPTEYLEELDKLYKLKKSNKLPKYKIHKFIKENYSSTKLNKKVYDQFFL